MRSRTVAVLVAALSLTGPLASAEARAPAPAEPPAVVRTDKGAVRGEVQQDHRRFQGIPYAKPPVGELRWKAPQPADPWTGVRDATRPGSQCAQLAPAYGGQTTYGEDCLYLNVTTPDRTGNKRLPVMVWVHGGGNTTGASTNYNAAKLAVDGQVVVVTLNYRLGALGWLAHPGLEGGDRVQAGNYGLLDQQAALRWVRRNIAAFGGDPRNVTLFGESAGSIDTCANIASPTAAGLFHKAIPQSGSCAGPSRTEQGAEADGARLAAAVGCTGPAAEVAACLRATPVKTLLETFAAQGMTAGPVAGGDHVLPLPPREAIERGRFNRVPVMHGNTLDEMRLYVALSYPRPITAEQYEQIVRTSYGADADEVLKRYPAANYDEPRHALAAVQTDFGGVLSTCLHQTAFRNFRRAGVPVYAYQFADRGAPPLIDVPGFDEGAEHATELTFLFPGLLGELDEPQRRLSDQMVAYWTSFARTGRPKAADAPKWPRYRAAGDVLSLAPGADGIRTVNTAEASNCAFWESLGR
ncbi:carboxylesterase/lipase family protein [Thermomonospora amylolytica]|uniref:carboxylesterase/lipase family protein n=1 Tax=Thermomonospora amylolytica TaxID=1411117 RepID=UPI000E6BCCB4|nr:carboxylesterase family protein [Thermomonospora amylolytica]